MKIKDSLTIHNIPFTLPDNYVVNTSLWQKSDIGPNGSYLLEHVPQFFGNKWQCEIYQLKNSGKIY